MSEMSPEEVCRGLCGDDEYHHKECPVAEGLRDCWCSPEWFTDMLPTVDLDPCSNERSTVKARRHIRLPENGLEVSWLGQSVYFNGPFSRLLPWARKAAEAASFIAMVNLDPSTTWWKTLVQSGGKYVFTFDKRVKFVPPPRIRQSTNSKPQALVCNWSGALMLDDRLNHLGQWWSAGGVLSVPTDLDTRVACD